MTWKASLQSALIFFVAHIFSTSAVYAADMQKIGVVGALNGQVIATSQDGKIRPLKAGDDVFLNDAITSDIASKAQIMFLDKSSLMINPESKVTVDKFVFNPATSQGDLTIQNAKGALRFIGGALSKEKPVTIKTPVATIGIRGGIADTFVAANGATDAVFVYGEELTMKNGAGQTVSVTEIGKGLGVADANSMPAELPKERIQMLQQTFTTEKTDAANDQGDSAASSDNQGTSNDNSTDKSDKKDAKGDAKADEPSEKNGKKDTSADGNKEANANKDGKDPNRGGNGPKKDGQAPANGRGDANAKGGNGERPLPMRNDNGIGMVNKIDSQNSTQNQQRVTTVNQFNERPFTPTHKGMYIVSNAGANPVSAGMAEFERTGDRLNGRFVQDYPQATGPRFTATLPWLQDAGYHAANPNDMISVDGRPFIANGYATADHAMSYYQMQEASGATKIGVLVGRMAPQTTWATSAATSNSANGSITHDLNFYSFLPDLMNHGGPSFGVFDYNIADNRLAPQAGGAQLGNLGLVVDWQHQRYLTGHMNWNSNTTNSLAREMILSFGNTNTATGSTRLLDGKLFEYVEAFTTTGSTSNMNSGFLRVNQAYSAADGGAFSGMLVEGIMPNDENLSSANIFTSNVEGTRTFQPVVSGSGSETSNLQAAASGGDRHTQTLKGYAAGYIRSEEYDSAGNLVDKDMTRYHNKTADGVSITTSATSGNVNATLNLKKGDAPSEFIEARFGQATDSTVQSAFLTDDLYASQQAKVSYGTGTTAAHEYTGNQVDNGALVNASLITDVPQSCTQCEFVHWGVWAGEVDRSNVSTKMRDVAAMVPYVAGTITENLYLKSFSPGTVNYNGVMYGQVLQNDNLNRQTGNFTAGIDLNNRQLKDFNANFGGMNFGFSGQTHAIASTGLASFNEISVHNLGTGSPGNINGVINGALFGPNAEDIAGNFSVNQIAGDIKEATGVYLGTSQ